MEREGGSVGLKSADMYIFLPYSCSIQTEAPNPIHIRNLVKFWDKELVFLLFLRIRNVYEKISNNIATLRLLF